MVHASTCLDLCQQNPTRYYSFQCKCDTIVRRRQIMVTKAMQPLLTTQNSNNMAKRAGGWCYRIIYVRPAHVQLLRPSPKVTSKGEWENKADAGPVEWQNNWCIIKAYGSWQRSISPLMRVVRAIGFENNRLPSNNSMIGWHHYAWWSTQMVQHRLLYILNVNVW